MVVCFQLLELLSSVGDTLRISKYFDTYIEGKRYKQIKIKKVVRRKAQTNIDHTKQKIVKENYTLLRLKIQGLYKSYNVFCRKYSKIRFQMKYNTKQYKNNKIVGGFNVYYRSKGGH